MKDIWHIPSFYFLSAFTLDVHLGEKCMLLAQGAHEVPSTIVSSWCDVNSVILQPETKMLATTRALHRKYWEGRKREKMKLRNINLFYSCSTLLQLVKKPKVGVVAASFQYTFCIFLAVCHYLDWLSPFPFGVTQFSIPARSESLLIMSLGC